MSETWQPTQTNICKIYTRKTIPIILSLQSKLHQINNKVLEKIRKLINAFSTFQFKLPVTKQSNFVLSSRLVNIKHPCWAQYSRSDCLHITVIPSKVEADAADVSEENSCQDF